MSKLVYYSNTIMLMIRMIPFLFDCMHILHVCTTCSNTLKLQPLVNDISTRTLQYLLLLHLLYYCKLKFSLYAA